MSVTGSGRTLLHTAFDHPTMHLTRQYTVYF